jgi:hypothetical protein
MVTWILFYKPSKRMKFVAQDNKRIIHAFKKEGEIEKNVMKMKMFQCKWHFRKKNILSKYTLNVSPKSTNKNTNHF